VQELSAAEHEMKQCLYIFICLVTVWFFTEKPHVLAASISSNVLKAKQAAEAKGYAFVTSKDEIVAKAKQEGKLEVLTFLEGDAKKAMTDAFQQKYPFVQTYAENISGTDQYQRFIPEMKAGRLKRWDTLHISNHFYSEYPPYLKKFDILGMAEEGVLQMPPQIVDSIHRNIVAKSSLISVAAYNKTLIAAEKVPTIWEGFLKAEFKGRKFVADIRPLAIANLVPVWGLEKTNDFARKVAAQEPVWTRGGTRALAAMIAGEYSLFMGLNLGSVLEVQAKDPTKSLEYQILEPVPVRFGSADGIVVTAPHPYAALLWLEFQVSPEGQKILDKYGPADGSVFVPGSVQHTTIRGKSLSFMNSELQQNINDWVKKVVEAYGFPVAEKGG
jgi:iron(III) transport system substrate-binding protein